MNKKIISSVVAAAAITSMFVGCGGDSGSSASLDYTVEDGSVLGAKLCDSSASQICAIQKDAKVNVYTFAKSPTLPVIATGGFIDLDGNGEYSVGDKVMKEMKSFYNNVTPMTTLVVVKADGKVANKDTAEKAILAELADSTLTVADLSKLPSKMDNAGLIAATYEVVKAIFTNTSLTTLNVDNANISIVIDSDNANNSSAVESSLYTNGTIPADANSEFLMAKYAIPVYANQTADKVAIYNNIDQAGWNTLATDTYTDYTMYRSDTTLNCATNFNGTVCTEQDNGQEALMTNILFAYNANVSEATNSNTTK